MPVEGGEETRILDQDVRFGYWRVLEKGICFLNQTATPPEVDFFDFATHHLEQIATVDRAKVCFAKNLSACDFNRMRACCPQAKCDSTLA